MIGVLPSGLTLRILDEFADGVLVTDQALHDHPIIYANDAFLRMTGFRREETIGRNCRFLHENDRGQPEIAAMRAAIAAGHPITATLRNYRRDGSMFYNEVRLSPLPDRDGEAAGFYVGFQRDVTARVDGEMELRRALDTADAANHARQRFLAIVNHEFRTPIGIIIGFADLLLQTAKQGRSSSRHDEYLRDIHAAALHLLGLLNDAQQYMDIIETRASPTRSTIQLFVLIKEATRLAEASLRASGRALSVQKLAGGPRIEANGAMLRQALVYLICDLARRAPHGASIDVSVDCQDTQASICLLCATLVMPQDAVDQIVGPLAAGDALYERGLEGAMMDVAVAAWIIRQHDGTLRVQRDAASGTGFVISLPAGRA